MSQLVSVPDMQAQKRNKAGYLNQQITVEFH